MSSPDSQQIAAKSDSPGLTLPAIFILVALFLVRGFILAAIMPPFEGWDEYQHVGYIDRCAESAQPVIYQQSNLDAAFLHAVAVFPRPEAAPLAAYGAATYAQFWTTGRLPAHDGHTPIELYEAQQPPLYYRLMASVYRLCGGRSDLPLAVSVLRLINVCFGAIAVALVLGWIRKDVPGSTALVMACWVAFHPLLLLNVMRVANDALAFLLGTAVVVILLSSHKRHFARQSILLAFLLPLAVLAKSTNLTLLPVAAAAIVIDVVRCQIKPLHALAASILILALGCAMTWSSFSFNLHHFGVLTSMQETIINHQANKHLLEVLTAMPIQSWAKTTGAMWVSQGLWTGGWSFLRMPLIAMIIYGTIIFLSACLLVAAILFRRGRSRLPIDPSRLTLMLLLLICVECGLMYHAAESYSAWSGVVSTNPWYAAMAIPWWMIVLCAGASTIPRPWGRLALLWSMPILCFIAELYGLLAKMIPFYSATPFGEESLRRLATLHPAGMGMDGVFTAAAIGVGFLIALIAIAVRSRA